MLHSTRASISLIVTPNWISTVGFYLFSLSTFNEYQSSQLEYNAALAGVAQWIEHRLVNQRVAGLIPSLGTCLGCRPSLQ